MMRTAVVILNWNGEGFLAKYLPGVVSSVARCPGARTVVADNASTDGSLALLKKDFPSVEVLPLSSNYGFAKGYNRALKELDDDLFVLLNSDVETPDLWLEPLVEWMELHPDCGICGPKLLSLKDRDRFEYAGAAGGFIDAYGYPFCRGRVLDMVEKDDGQYDCPYETFWMSGAALMVRREVFAALGGFNAGYFMHMEEIDLCWRARMAGWKVHYVPRSAVYHLGGGTLGKDSPTKIYYNHRNNLLMLYANLPFTGALLTGFEALAAVSDQEQGPDFFGNCYDAYDELSDDMRSELCTMAAKLGMNVMRSTIAKRRFLDFLAACGYLVGGSPKAFRAVFRAHRDFRRMRRSTKLSRLKKDMDRMFSGGGDDTVRVMLLDVCSEDAPANLGLRRVALRGVLDRWTVFQRYFAKRSIFALIKDSMI